MGHERLKYLKDTLTSLVECQMCNIGQVNTEELGEAIDMIKDLEEAIYYCVITEAMEGKGGGGFEFEVEHKQKNAHHQEGNGQMYNRDYGMMYNQDYGRMYNRGNDTMYNRMYDNDWERMYNRGESSGGNSRGSSGGNRNGNGGSSSSYYSEPMMRDAREGRSPESRRMYLEAKEQGRDKAYQLRELEKYMQELSQDVIDVIQEATPEEKQYLEKKISTLASKISQMK